ncbi:major capsid protein [Pseudomonas phage phiK7B1]|nr:major capsid protein [Pseudomonas phage phiK7B1]
MPRQPATLHVGDAFDSSQRFGGLQRQTAVPLQTGTSGVFVLHGADVFNTDTSRSTAVQAVQTIHFVQAQSVHGTGVRGSALCFDRDEVVDDDRDTVVSRNLTVVVELQHAAGVTTSQTPQRFQRTQGAGTHHQRVRATAVQFVDQLVQHGQRNRTAVHAGLEEVTGVFHQLLDTVERLVVHGAVALDDCAAEGTGHTLGLHGDLKSQLAVLVAHGFVDEFVHIDVASQDSQLGHDFFNVAGAFWHNFVDVQEAAFRVGQFTDVHQGFTLGACERQQSEQIIAVDDFLDNAAEHFLLGKLFSNFAQQWHCLTPSLDLNQLGSLPISTEPIRLLLIFLGQTRSNSGDARADLIGLLVWLLAAQISVLRTCTWLALCANHRGGFRVCSIQRRDAFFKRFWLAVCTHDRGTFGSTTRLVIHDSSAVHDVNVSAELFPGNGCRDYGLLTDERALAESTANSQVHQGLVFLAQQEVFRLQLFAQGFEFLRMLGFDLLQDTVVFTTLFQSLALGGFLGFDQRLQFFGLRFAGSVFVRLQLVGGRFGLALVVHQFLQQFRFCVGRLVTTVGVLLVFLGLQTVGFNLVSSGFIGSGLVGLFLFSSSDLFGGQTTGQIVTVAISFFEVDASAAQELDQILVHLLSPGCSLSHWFCRSLGFGYRFSWQKHQRDHAWLLPLHAWKCWNRHRRPAQLSLAP